MRTVPADFVCFLLLLLSAAAVSRQIYASVCPRLLPRQASLRNPLKKYVSHLIVLTDFVHFFESEFGFYISNIACLLFAYTNALVAGNAFLFVYLFLL